MALESLFGATTDGEPNEDGTPAEGGGISSDLTQAELILRAAAAYESAITAQKDGRWADYGTHMQTLQKLLEALESMTNNEASMDLLPEDLLEELELEVE